ncbi:MAG TPA: hypothetical protein PKC97_16495 [Burkholderiaceae bacterium]|nr:hypothetical protein [Burkholderiaceae bacterium]
MKAEDVGHRLIELALLPAKQIAARRGFQPASQTYNRAVLRHEFNCTATFSNRNIRAPDARAEAIAGGPARTAPARAAMKASASALTGILVMHSRSRAPGCFARRGVGPRRAMLATTLESKDKNR